MKIRPEETAAIIIDMQEKLMPAMEETSEVEKRSCLLLRGLREMEVPLIMTQQYTKGLGMTVPAIVEAAGTNQYYDKISFSCCEDEAIMQAFQDMGRKNILVIGTEAHICILQTCIGLVARGFQPVLVLDCIASRRMSNKLTGIERAKQEGVLVTSSESILFELLGSAKSSHFRKISELIK